MVVFFIIEHFTYIALNVKSCIQFLDGAAFRMIKSSTSFFWVSGHDCGNGGIYHPPGSAPNGPWNLGQAGAHIGGEWVGGVWLAWSGPTRVRVQILKKLFKFGLIKHSCKS